MNRDDVTRWAREAGFVGMDGEHGALRRLAQAAYAAGAAAEREKYKWDIHSCGPTCTRYACVATREAVAAEREACAKVCEDLYANLLDDLDVRKRWPEQKRRNETYAAAIRARGQA